MLRILSKEDQERITDLMRNPRGSIEKTLEKLRTTSSSRIYDYVTLAFDFVEKLKEARRLELLTTIEITKYNTKFNQIVYNI